ncbi:MAG: CheR family methyltransferase [Bacteroidota bacterium]
MRVEISDEELNSLTSAIMTRHGVDFTSYEPKSLKRRVVRALSVFKLGSIHELWMKILKEADFVHPFVNELSVGLTAMFRDPQFWEKLSTILPGFVKERGRLDVWHAGCSTGEEVYTFNIMLRELGLDGAVKSYASDMNMDAVEQAKKGIYHMMKLAEYEHNYAKYNGSKSLADYYRKEDKYGTMDSSLTANVRFGKNNLITDKTLRKYDIVFCRNVMIYFDSNAKKLVLDKFYDCLRPGGLLIIGFLDLLLPVLDKSKFDFCDLGNKILKKQG